MTTGNRRRASALTVTLFSTCESFDLDCEVMSVCPRILGQGAHTDKIPMS